jgi:hypothetical protein
MIALQRLEHTDERFHRPRRRQQAKCVAGRSGVDDHHVEARGKGREAHDFDQADQLVDAWHRELEHLVDIVPIEPRAVLDDVRESTAVLAEPARKCLGRIDLRGVQRTAGAADSGDSWRQRRTEGVAE